MAFQGDSQVRATCSRATRHASATISSTFRPHLDAELAQVRQVQPAELEDGRQLRGHGDLRRPREGVAARLRQAIHLGGPHDAQQLGHGRLQARLQRFLSNKSRQLWGAPPSGPTAAGGRWSSGRSRLPARDAWPGAGIPPAREARCSTSPHNHVRVEQHGPTHCDTLNLTASPHAWMRSPSSPTRQRTLSGASS